MMDCHVITDIFSDFRFWSILLKTLRGNTTLPHLFVKLDLPYAGLAHRSLVVVAIATFSGVSPAHVVLTGVPKIWGTGYPF